MHRWQLDIARRLLGSAARLASVGVGAGVATLIVVLGVMNGFQSGTIESLLELSSFHVRIELSAATPEDLDALARRLADRPGVAAAIPQSELQTLVTGFWSESQAVEVRGVPADWLDRDRGARDALTLLGGSIDLGAGRVVLGGVLARSLGVRVGDPVTFTFIPGGRGAPREVTLEVSGIVASRSWDIDRSAAFVSLATAAAAFEGGEQQLVGLKLDNRFADSQAVAALRPYLDDAVVGEISGADATIVGWREYNRGIFGALRAEKAMMVALIALIFVVLAGTIHQILRRAIVERAEEIAILLATGASPASVRAIFTLHGWIIGVAGTIGGSLVGMTIAVNVNGIFGLAAAVTARVAGAGTAGMLALDAVPAGLVWYEVLLVVAGALAMCVLIGDRAARAALVYRPAEMLRGE